VDKIYRTDSTVIHDYVFYGDAAAWTKVGVSDLKRQIPKAKTHASSFEHMNNDI
jgi:hypothetical protein